MSEDPNFEETSLFDFSMPAQEKEAKPLKKKKTGAKPSAPAPSFPVNAEKTDCPLPDKQAEDSAPAAETPVAAAASSLWHEKFWEYDITSPSQQIRDDMKEKMVQEGFTKREANRVFKGLFFKEKVFNTKVQAIEFLKTVPTTYAVKFKIGIEPSPQMISLKQRLQDKEKRLREYRKNQAVKKFQTEFVTCPACHSKVNSKYITPPLCPVCRSDMRAESVIHMLESLETAVADLKKRYENTARKYNSRFTGGEKWIIRTIKP